MAGEIRTCGRCGTLPGEPCQGDSGDFCVGLPGDGTDCDGLPIDHLAGARWWTCLVGTTWCVIDADDTDRHRQVRQRAYDTLRRGGIVRHATDSEMRAWTELAAIAARLREASTAAQRLEVLAHDRLDAVQLEMI